MMQSLPEMLAKDALLTILRDLSERQEFYLVGGAVRDWLLSRPFSDIDLISPEAPTAAAKALAREQGGHWFWLDESRGHSRVLLRGDRGQGLSFDFSPFRAETLKADLADRDFTVNAMAMPLASTMDHSDLVDPFLGIADLDARLIRAVAPGSMSADPLRVLRGLRHATELQFEIECQTRQSMVDASVALQTVAVERIRQEFWALLEKAHERQALRLLHDVGADQVLFGASVAPHEVLVHTLWQTLDRLVEARPALRSVLTEDVEQGLNRAVLVVWALLLVRVAPSLPLRVAEQWRCSLACRRRLAAIVHFCNAPEQILSRVACRGRPLRLWARSLGGDPADLLLTACLLCRISGQDSGRYLPFLDLLDRSSEPCDDNDLVSGEWLQKEFQLKPGKEIGRLIDALRQAEIEGRVESVADAETLIRGLLEK